MKRYLLEVERTIFNGPSNVGDGKAYYTVGQVKIHFLEYDVLDDAERSCRLLTDLNIGYVLYDVYEGIKVYDTRLPY